MATSTSTPSIHLRVPPSWFFKFPPDAQPLALPPPTDARTFAAPFGIPTDIYNGALDYKVPITIATLYAATAIVWNRVNRNREYKPYAFSKTRAFKAFVILHNVFLAVFSAFTFFGMLRALAHTWPGREHHLLGKYWPGLRAQYSLAGAADALCKMHGPRGYGQFVAFRPDSALWQAQGKTVQLLATGYPDGSDVGRLWNEGLAFWGWWFYLSKFYEVFDTFIILAKGKRSSTLQTYHHTGAMMCMWAGIRYMSPPIWMFCFLNSGIHTMMYIYYTLSALSIRVPTRIKRSLTTMQISQFLVGITFAALHLFVTYDIPLTKAEAVSKTLESMASSVVSGASAATSAGLAAWLKQAALRAAGEEGLAENVLAPPAQAAYKRLSEQYTPEQQSYGSGYETVPCIDTSGQSFAIWLNLAYLAPLTGLFVRFFVKSYTRRGAASRGGKKGHQAIEAAKDAAHGTDRKVDEVGKGVEKGVDDIAKEANGQANGKANGNGTPRSRKVSGTIKREWERFEKGGEQVADAAKNGKAGLRKKVSEGHDKLRRMFEEGSISERSKSPSSSSVQEEGQEQEEQRGRTMSDASSAAKDYITETKEAAEKKVEELVEAAREAVSGAEKDVSSRSEEPAHDETKKPNELEQSWADVAKDTYPKPDVPSTSEQPSEADTEQEQDRSETPTPQQQLSKQRSLSPQKSKLPRPASRTRSPVKQDKEKKSSIPRPATNNGTNKPQHSSENSRPSSSGSDKDKDKDKDAKTTSEAPSKPEGEKRKPKKLKSKSKSKSESEPTKTEEEKKEVQTSSLPLSPAAPNTSSASAVSDEKAELDAFSTPSKDVKEEEEQNTNGESTQDRAPSSTEQNTEVEAPSDKDSKEALQFRHVSDESGEKGGEAERKEGVSFAEAVKGEEEGKKVEEGDISID